MDSIEDIKKECERYRLLYESADSSLAYWQAKCRRLEIKIQMLEKKNREISNNSEILHENNCLRIANARLNEDLSQTEVSMREWKKQSIKHRQALQEIREICKNSYTSVNEDYYRTSDKIQDKINEVIGGK